MTSKNTPVIGSVGRYQLTPPFKANPNIVYECLAVRTFTDCERRGEDVYSLYYLSMGLKDGVEYDSGVFHFNEQVTQGAKIITLKGSDDTLLYVPDTYISALPNEGVVPYSVIVLSAMLGMLPTNIALDSLISDVQALVSAKMGTEIEVKIHATSSPVQPTRQEHDVMQSARLGAIKDFDNVQTRLNKALVENALMKTKITSLIKYIQETGTLDGLLKQEDN